MRVPVVLTVIGPDRPGLVASLSQIIAAHEGNWLQSCMTRLAGMYSGIVLVSIPETKVAALNQALNQLAVQEGFKMAIEVSGGEHPLRDYRILNLELTGQDHPGIVRDISHALASRNINIEELVTKCIDASWSGESLFQAKARLYVPANVSTGELKRVLETLANELMVDIVLDEPPAQ